jgi:hypothetical protein
MARSVPSIAVSHEKPFGRDGYEVRTPYHPAWLDRMKARVPSADRRWWEDSKAWWIAAEQRDFIERITLELFGEVDLIDENGEVHTKSKDGQRFVQERLL